MLDAAVLFPWVGCRALAFPAAHRRSIVKKSALKNTARMRSLCVWLLLLGASACTEQPPPVTPLVQESRQENTTPLDPEVAARFWKVRGSRIEDGSGREVQLRGIAFGNQVWEHVPIPSAHHTGTDFQVVRSMGMNSVRFYLSYKSFEDDDQPFEYKQSGWAWLDQNVEWAKEAGVRLILNMHAPVGGYQSGGEGDGLWTDEQAEQRFLALWRAIAARYRAEPTIAGYGLLNEPAPVDSMDQWKQLAERTIAEIRAVDQHHMIFIERTASVGGDWAENADRNFFRVSDDNVVYEFHFYKPYHFTHQSAEWSEFAAREMWYPDDRRVANDWFQLKLEGKAESAALPPGDSDWTLLETSPFVVDDHAIRVGKPFLVCDRNAGKASFDSLSLTRIADDNMETLFEIDLDTRRGWYFWEEMPGGMADFEPEGHGDSTAVSISETTGAANLGSDPLRFFVEAGSEYTLQALVKGESLPADANCGLRLEFYSADVPVLPYSKDFLEQELTSYLEWGRENRVPLYLGEFGTIRQSFLPGRGGLTWVEDMLDLIEQHDVHFAYHAYHEMPFGLFLGSDTLPSRWALYQPLYDLLTAKLGGSGKAPWPEELPSEGGSGPAPTSAERTSGGDSSEPSTEPTDGVMSFD